LQGLQEHKNVA